MAKCEHGWRSATDCDTCAIERVSPIAADRIEQFDIVIDDLYVELCAVQDHLPTDAWERIKALIAKVQV